MMLSSGQYTALLLVRLILTQVATENTLTYSEMQIFIDNGFEITINQDTGTVTYEHHGLPAHASDKGWVNPNDAVKVYHSYDLPLEATVAEEPGCAGGLGLIGLAISGAAFFNPYTDFGWNAVEGECSEDLDSCWGHPTPDGTYHYHSIPECLYTGDLRDKLLGVALDGYPIYGPMDNTTKIWTSADLDQCHGHDYNGRYIYRATFDFPYIISCFHGKDAKDQVPRPAAQKLRPGRERRHSDGHDVQRRQIQPPIGLEDDKCWNSKYNRWDTRICLVVCENAGQVLDDCPSDIANTSSQSASSITACIMLCTLGFLSTFL